MSISLTDHQWEAVKTAADWYREADRNRADFEAMRFSNRDPLSDDAPETLLGKGQDFFFGGYAGTDDVPETLLGKGQDFFFGGYAGTGKTTVLPAAIESMGLSPEDVAFCAPTGKAAKVMGEKLRGFGMNVTPTTIHKLIYLPKRARADAIQAEIDRLKQSLLTAKAEGGSSVYLDGIEGPVSIKQAEQRLKELNFDLIRAMDNDDGPKFSLRSFHDFPERAKLIVVDEGSMVGKDIATDLATFGRPILAFGDPGQLPPVQDEYGFDCHNPDAFLTEIHRQAQDNPIIRLATLAREGKDIPINDYGSGVKVVDRRNDDVTLNMDREAMIICGTHKKRWSLTKKIRTALGYTESGPGTGEPLMFVKNSLRLSGMVNGTIVECMTDHGDLVDGDATMSLRVRDLEGGTGEYDVVCAQGLFEEHHLRRRNSYTAPSSLAFKAKREKEHLDWAHVITCHKSQGSQWDDVVVHDESGVFRSDASRWLYTAITRAAQRLTVVV